MVTVPSSWDSLGYLMWRGWDIKFIDLGSRPSTFKFYCCKQEEHP